MEIHVEKGVQRDDDFVPVAVAHQPDEYVTIAAIERVTDVYAKLIQRFCIESA